MFGHQPLMSAIINSCSNMWFAEWFSHDLKLVVDTSARGLIIF